MFTTNILFQIPFNLITIDYSVILPISANNVYIFAHVPTCILSDQELTQILPYRLIKAPCQHVSSQIYDSIHFIHTTTVWRQISLKTKSRFISTSGIHFHNIYKILVPSCVLLYREWPKLLTIPLHSKPLCHSIITCFLY